MLDEAQEQQEEEQEKPFAVERAKTGRSKCKKCKYPIDKDEVRIAKIMANPFGDGKMKAWHHVNCMFEVFTRQRATTKRIENPQEDITGWDLLRDEDKAIIEKSLADFEDAEPFKVTKVKAMALKANEASNKTSEKNTADVASGSGSKIKDSDGNKNSREDKVFVAKKKENYSRDDMFLEFQKICDKISSCSAYLEKTAILRKLFIKGSDKDGFKSDIVLWCTMLLPGTAKRIYNLQSKMLIKLFARIFCEDETTMLEDLEQGDVAQTIKTFYERSLAVKPNATSELRLQEVDKFLEKLSTLTKEEEQTQHFKSILNRCTADDLKMIVRLIKHDLRINAGPKHILDAIHSDAYQAFQVSRNLPAIIRRFLEKSVTTITTSPSSLATSSSSGSTSSLSKSPKTDGGKLAKLKLMTPVLPMLAEACKSVDMAIEKCPHGMFSEVKYDGERVQVHKMGNEFRYFSRSLKPVLPHKVNFLKDYIPRAFPEGDDLILDAEILLIDTNNGQPLPFGSLGIHKKTEFKDANVCLFVFDIIYYNGEPLMDRPIRYRRKLLQTKMTPIPNRIVLSEIQEINDPQTLAEMIVKVFKLRLEGLVLKSVDSKYEPGKRHWLKVKKDYLFEGAMADSADLVVIGAWYGTGQKGGIMSVFLMGCYDPECNMWLTVTKVHTGHDDATLTELQGILDMVKISKDPKLVPKWLKVNKPMIPDFVARDPKNQPVWEITGAEFTNQGVHTADGISIRFPRVTRIRDDKDWKTATNLQELKKLFSKSAESMDYSLLLGQGGSKRRLDDDDDDDNEDRLEIKPKKLKKTHHPKHSTSKKIVGNSSDDDFIDDTQPEEKINSSDEEKYPVKQTKQNKKSEVKSPKTPSRKSSDKSPRKPSDKSPRKSSINSSEKSPGKLLTKYQEVKAKEDNNSNESFDENQENRAQFYSFIGNDYIEYSAAGSPLNWINGRKPPKYLPIDAKPISECDEYKKKSRCILTDARVYIAKDINRERRKIVQGTLKTLGAEILREGERSQATHVVHGHDRVPATILTEFSDVPRSARHVRESWVESTAKNCKVENTLDHAVSLYGVYCSCPCPHSKN